MDEDEDVKFHMKVLCSLVSDNVVHLSVRPFIFSTAYPTQRLDPIPALILQVDKVVQDDLFLETRGSIE